jgi:hypothetical protein
MIESYQHLEEFDGYFSSYTSMKSIIFKKEIKGQEYLIKIKSGGFFQPIIYLKLEDKRFKEVDVKEASIEIKQLFDKIEAIRNDANKNFKSFLPGVEHEEKNNKIKYTDIIEDIENFNDLELYPSEIYIWGEIYKDNNYKFDCKITIENMSKQKHITPLYKIKTIAFEKTEGITNEMELFIQKQGNMIEMEINKPYRLKHLFEKYEAVK